MLRCHFKGLNITLVTSTKQKRDLLGVHKAKLKFIGWLIPLGFYLLTQYMKPETVNTLYLLIRNRSLKLSLMLTAAPLALPVKPSNGCPLT